MSCRPELELERKNLSFQRQRGLLGNPMVAPWHVGDACYIGASPAHLASLEKNLNTQLIGETGLSSTSSTVAGETAEYETMMEKIFVNMVQKALAKQQAAENQINIDNNNRAKATNIEIENKSEEDKTESDAAEGTSSGSDPGPKGGGGEVENEVEEKEEKFPWRNALVESAKQLWQKKLVEASENETVAKKILESRQKWRGNIIAEMGEDGLWKVNVLSLSSELFCVFIHSLVFPPMHRWSSSQIVKTR